MPFTFDATEGGANANSFATVEFADEILAGELYADAWPETSVAEDLETKQKALVSATRELNALDYQGQRTDWNTPQALQFPRVNLKDRDGNYLDSSTNPFELKLATVYLALFRLEQNPAELVDETLRQFKRLKISDVLDMEMRDGVSSETGIPERVLDLISRWLLISGSTTRIVRA